MVGEHELREHAASRVTGSILEPSRTVLRKGGGQRRSVGNYKTHAAASYDRPALMGQDISPGLIKELVEGREKFERAAAAR